MNREIKFRIWDGEINKMILWQEIRKERIADIEGHTKLYVMQYTGLKDRNGKEIYEGDITSENRYFIFNRNGFWYKQINGDGNFPIVFWVENQPIEFEVIGNIHENPELIKQINLNS